VMLLLLLPPPHLHHLLRVVLHRVEVEIEEEAEVEEADVVKEEVVEEEAGEAEEAKVARVVVKAKATLVSDYGKSKRKCLTKKKTRERGGRSQ